jgi:transcriptional regulator with XRE-family HTH domain
MTVGDRIRSIRKENKLTQEQFATTLNLAQATIVRYENGSIAPSLEVLIKISIKFKVDISLLLDSQKNRQKTYTCPQIVKDALKDNANNTNLISMLKKGKISNSVKRRSRLMGELDELRAVAQDLTTRIIAIQDEIKKGI